MAEENPLGIATADGRNFAVSGGVAKAVAHVIEEMDPTREVKIKAAQGLRECKKMLLEAKKGMYDGYLLEGMGCPGGCVAGAGTIQAVNKAAALVGLYAGKSKHEGEPLTIASDNKYAIIAELLD